MRARAERIKAVSDRMIRLGQQLLVLARADPNAHPQDRFVRVDLCEWVRASGAEWIPRAAPLQVDVDLNGAGISRCGSTAIRCCSTNCWATSSTTRYATVPAAAGASP